MANDSNIKVVLDNVGYQKAVDILVFGINNIKYVEVEPLSDYNIVINNNLVYPDSFEDEGKTTNIYYIKNTIDNCEYVFEEEIVDNSYVETVGGEDSEDKENVTLFSIGHIMITKLKLPKVTINQLDVVGIPFLLKVGYLDENNVKKSKLIYFSIRIPYSTIASEMELPLYYRPFYFNSVLLLTPQNMTPDYYYDVKNLHKNKRKDDIETTTIEKSDTYLYRIEVNKNYSKTKTKSVVESKLNITLPSMDKSSGQYFKPVFKGEASIVESTTVGNRTYDYHSYSLNMSEENFKELLEFNKRGEDKLLKDIKICFKYQVIPQITFASNAEDAITIIFVYDNENNSKNKVSLTRKDNTNIWYGDIEYVGPYEPRNIIIEVEKENNSDSFICKLYCIKKDCEEITNPNENCYGRLFYSIANGCSLRNDLGKKNTYELNNVTLSYINGNKHGNMVLKKPFRCFSEMEGSEKGRATSINGTDKLTREMMYGITEPLRFKKMDVDESTIKENVYFTSENGSERGTITLNVNDPQSKGEGNIETTSATWKHRKHNSGLVDEVATDYEIEWRSQYVRDKEYGGGGIVQRRYVNYIYIYEKVGDERIEIAYCKLERRRTSTSVVHTVRNDKNEKIAEWHINYTLHSTLTGKATLSVWGVYTDTYNVEEKITRDGFPCINISDNNGGISDELYIDKFIDKTTGKLHGNYDIDLYNIYTDVGIKDGYNNIVSPIDVLQKYKMEYNKYNDNEKIVPLIFDTSQWLDISFSVTEGHPEDEIVFSQEFVGFNDVKFYDDIYWGEEIDEGGKEYKGVHVKGYSSSNIRYFALAPKTDNNTDEGYNEENEILTFLKSLYGIGATDYNNLVRYNGVNINDYIPTVNNNPLQPATRNCGWKSIHTFFKGFKNNTVWLSGKSNESQPSHECIEITGILNSLYKNNEQKVNMHWGCSTKKNRGYIIGICDNYTNLDGDLYREEKNYMYSIIKPHTSRFAVIRLYTLYYHKEEE